MLHSRCLWHCHIGIATGTTALFWLWLLFPINIVGESNCSVAFGSWIFENKDDRHLYQYLSLPTLPIVIENNWATGGGGSTLTMTAVTLCPVRAWGAISGECPDSAEVWVCTMVLACLGTWLVTTFLVDNVVVWSLTLSGHLFFCLDQKIARARRHSSHGK